MVHKVSVVLIKIHVKVWLKFSQVGELLWLNSPNERPQISYSLTKSVVAMVFVMTATVPNEMPPAIAPSALPRPGAASEEDRQGRQKQGRHIVVAEVCVKYGSCNMFVCACLFLSMRLWQLA